jgi:hypothetical protein
LEGPSHTDELFCVATRVALGAEGERFLRVALGLGSGLQTARARVRWFVDMGIADTWVVSNAETVESPSMMGGEGVAHHQRLCHCVNVVVI